jgi:hypothetical protein
MRSILNTIAKCALAFEVNGEGCRLIGNGLIGVLAAAVLIALIIIY